MIAASALVVAVLASYAGIGVLSLSATTPFSALSQLPGVKPIVAGIGWNPPTVKSVTALGRKAVSGATSLGVLSDAGVFNLGSLAESSGPQALPLKNTSSSPVTYTLNVSGPGLTASFDNHSSQRTVAPKHSATVYVSSSPLYAGPINGQLVLSAAGFGSQTIPIHGIQAPLPPGAVTATPARGGAVDLSWVPSGSVSGVAGYVVKRRSNGTTFTQVGGQTKATTAVDQTPSDGQYTYEVVAVSAGSPGVPSAAGPSGSVTSDSQAPGQPTGFGQLPQYINQASVDQPFPVTVQLPAGSQASDTITVTATDASGTRFTQTTSGGGASAQVSFDPSQFAQGDLGLSAAATDAAGNTSTPLLATKASRVDTVAPLAPMSVSTPPVIATGNDSALPVTVQVSSSVAPNDELDVSLQGVTGQPLTKQFTVAQAGSPLPVDASGLPDGKVTVTAWIVDPAGNASAATPADPEPTKDTTGPPAPTQFEIPAGPDNPVNVVTPQSAESVYITATFAQAPPVDEEIKVFGHHQTIVDQQGDGQTTSFTFGPFDFSGVEPGTHTLGMNLIDSVGNNTWSQFSYTVDAGAQSPQSVGVPAGPNNPAGYVNAATQAAATIVATFAASTDPADQITLSVDGVSLGTQSGGSNTVSWTGDLSSLPDGTLDILGTITDPNGVTSTFHGSLIKDTTPPPAPAVAGVVGPPPNVITPEDASCVKVAVAFNQAPDPSDTVTVTLSDGSSSVQGSAQAGEGQVTVDCMDASSLDTGPVSVTVTVTDVAANSVTFTGTPAAKVGCKHTQDED